MSKKGCLNFVLTNLKEEILLHENCQKNVGTCGSFPLWNFSPPPSREYPSEFQEPFVMPNGWLKAIKCLEIFILLT